MNDSYEVFKQQVYDLTRIDLNSYKERQMKRRIDSLITKNKFDSYREFVQAIRENKEMLDEFVNYLTINVSEFYRNPEQWAILEKDILPLLFEKFGKPLKIWSAACSTGDEPYSLVMLLSKFMPLRQIKIIATDIDKQILEKARLGIYNVKSLKGLPDEFVSKYFHQINERTYQISDEIKSCVDFREHNLLRDEYINNCDLIICRNVLIYFTEDAKEVIYRNFNKALKKEAMLFVGSTEQIINPKDLGFASYRSFFYTKA